MADEPTQEQLDKTAPGTLYDNIKTEMYTGFHKAIAIHTLKTEVNEVEGVRQVGHAFVGTVDDLNAMSNAVLRICATLMAAIHGAYEMSLDIDEQEKLELRDETLNDLLLTIKRHFEYDMQDNRTQRETFVENMLADITNEVPGTV